MPKKKVAKKKQDAEVIIGPKIEEMHTYPAVTTVSEAIAEVNPKKHIVMVKIKKSLPNIPVPVEFPVGEVMYWEYTDEITYSYEAGHQIYMDNFVNRAIQTGPNQWVPRQSTRKWVENLPDAILPDGYFTSEILTMDEVE